MILTVTLTWGGVWAPGLQAGEGKANPGALSGLVQEQLGEAGKDFVYLLQAPLRAGPKTFLQLAGLVFLEAGMVYHLDRKVDEEFALEGSHMLLYPAEQLAGVGEAYDRMGPENVAVGVVALTGVAGLVLNNSRLIETARLAFESTLATGVMTIGLKEVFGRARPYVAGNPQKFRFFSFSGQEAYRSFPSGHTSSAFALATVFALQYPRWWVNVAAYGIATGVALQRMEDRMHWSSDVVFGAVLGSWVAHQLVKASSGRHRGQNRIQAFVQPYRMGVTIRF